MGDVWTTTQRELGSRVPGTQQQKMIKAYLAGASIRTIAADECSCYSTVRRVLVEGDVTFRRRGSPRGERRGGRKRAVDHAVRQ